MIHKTLIEMSDEEIDNYLWRFYGEARSKSGEEYSRSSLLGIRNAIERHLASHDRHVNIAKNTVFQRSNKMLESKLKSLRRSGKETVKHKAVIQTDDMKKIKESAFLNPDTPHGLLY